MTRSARWPLSVLLTSLPADFEAAVAHARELGFSHVDVVALGSRPESHRAALADADVIVSCAALGRGLPDGVSLYAADLGARRAAVDLVRAQVADAAILGATHAYLVPPKGDDGPALVRFADACGHLAAYASARMVRLCIEQSPGTLLARPGDVLAWLDKTGLATVDLLLDVGHCLLTHESPAVAIRAAGKRLGYVHLDDNDGQGDVHWPLLRGQLSRQALSEVFVALNEVGYTGAVALELAPAGDQSADGLRASRDVVVGVCEGL